MDLGVFKVELEAGNVPLDSYKGRFVAVLGCFPPLNIKDEEIAEAGERLSRALDRAASAPS